MVSLPVSPKRACRSFLVYCFHCCFYFSYVCHIPEAVYYVWRQSWVCNEHFLYFKVECFLLACKCIISKNSSSQTVSWTTFALSFNFSSSSFSFFQHYFSSVTFLWQYIHFSCTYSWDNILQSCHHFYCITGCTCLLCYYGNIIELCICISCSTHNPCFLFSL